MQPCMHVPQQSAQPGASHPGACLAAASSPEHRARRAARALASSARPHARSRPRPALASPRADPERARCCGRWSAQWRRTRCPWAPARPSRCRTRALDWSSTRPPTSWACRATASSCAPAAALVLYRTHPGHAPAVLKACYLSPFQRTVCTSGQTVARCALEACTRHLLDAHRTLCCMRASSADSVLGAAGPGLPRAVQPEDRARVLQHDRQRRPGRQHVRHLPQSGAHRGAGGRDHVRRREHHALCGRALRGPRGEENVRPFLPVRCACLRLSPPLPRSTSFSFGPKHL